MSNYCPECAAPPAMTTTERHTLAAEYIVHESKPPTRRDFCSVCRADWPCFTERESRRADEAERERDAMRAVVKAAVEWRRGQWAVNRARTLDDAVERYLAALPCAAHPDSECLCYAPIDCHSLTPDDAQEAERE